MQANELRNTLERYKFDNFIEDMRSLEEKITLKIGFIGEFNSGKSTLINKLIGQKILPTMDEPTSKTIVEIEGANIENPEYYKYIGVDRESISAIEFSDICTTLSEYTLYLRLPIGRFLKKDYLLIDTPGISSLDQSDEDITFGYLPKLDAAVLCQDIQIGALNKSIINFILKPEVRPMLNHFIFAITKSDMKMDPEKIRSNITLQLHELNDKHCLGLNHIEKRVMLISKEEGSDEFDKIIDKFIFKQKQRLQEERRDKEYHAIAQKALSLLKNQKKDAKLDIDDIKTEEDEIEKAIETLKKNEQGLKEKFDRFEEKMQSDIRGVLTSRLPEIAQVKDKEELQEQIKIVEHSVIEKANMRATRYIGNAGLDTVDSSMLVSVSEQVASILSVSNIGKQVGSFLLFAILIPGASAAANAAEGAGGMAVREAGKKGAKAVAVNAAKEAAKEGMKKATKMVILKNVLDILDKINPIEIVGNIIQGKLIESKLQENIISISTNLAFAIRDDLEERLEDFIGENREELENKKILLNALYDKKRERGEEFSQYLDQVSADIGKLVIYAE